MATKTIRRHGALWLSEANEAFAFEEDGEFFISFVTGEIHEIVRQVSEDMVIVA